MNYLLITLGHGSSAVLVYSNGKKVIGYEQERLSGVKSDSQFPTDAINEIAKHVGMNMLKGCTVYVSHWFNSTGDADVDAKVFIGNKYLTHANMFMLDSFASKVVFVNPLFTHHDAHAYSAAAFFKSQFDSSKHKLKEETMVHTIVADGFGTNEEVLSVYVSYDKGTTQTLLHRATGFEKSIGLMYQYATSFCGMKENQDEYKFLGYESHIEDVLRPTEIAKLYNLAKARASILYKGIMDKRDIYSINASDGIIDFAMLANVKANWHLIFDQLCCTVSYIPSDFSTRCVVACYIQFIVEDVMRRVANYFKISDVIVAGGCFYNVKLNNSILNHIDGLFCAMPLAGDQGAAIGMLTKFTDIKFDFSTLAIGQRDYYHAEKIFVGKEGVTVFNREHMSVDMIAAAVATEIANGELVNIVEGNMEFGPRALCNTSTLFLPSTKNTANNNKMNNRNEVMPCAPVVTSGNAGRLFNQVELNRVVGSDQYMICTHEYIRPFSLTCGGVMHFMPKYDSKTGELSEVSYTGRPQIAQCDSFIERVLLHVDFICDAKCLVNTSFNAHGRPIAFTMQDVLSNFMYQREHAGTDQKPLLFVIL